ncbi:MAG: ABC transporter permease [Bacteroidetes bacterium]|nr:ABC transporter permease [Bacteroidota bacterium]
MSGKINLIILREYLTRVKKKSFIIMTIVGPLLMAGIIIVPVWFATREGDVHFITVVDESQLFINGITDTKSLKFFYSDKELAEVKENFYREKYSAILYIPATVVQNISAVQIFYKKQPGIMAQEYIKETIEKKIESEKLIAQGIEESVLRSIKTKIKLVTLKLKESGSEEKSFAELSSVVGLVGGFLIYIFIFLYGTLVMRGVMEEKTNRIVEIIVSSVRPFQLMMGKVIGIAFVGLTQFLLWVVITFFIVGIFQNVYLAKKFNPEEIFKTTAPSSLSPGQLGLDTRMLGSGGNEEAAKIFEAVQSINFPVVLLMFLFYFLGGYLLYSALFAAIGAAVDNDTDTQQFIFPLTIPLILAIIMAQFIINNPDSSLSFWFSVIPLTSPVIMMVRIPFGVPVWELSVSIALLVAGFAASIWLAAKVYRVGILMYGKKVSYAELWKWIRYS